MIPRSHAISSPHICVVVQTMELNRGGKKLKRKRMLSLLLIAFLYR